MFNESGFIERCIESIGNQDYPKDKLDIVVVDGGSTDDSVRWIVEARKKDPRIRLFFNPARRTPISLNTGIKNSKGSIVIILGAHTRIRNDFIGNNVRTMQIMQIPCVGGTQINVGDTFLQKAIGLGMGSPFGLASAPYRFGKKPQFVDTVVYAAYQKALFDEVGLFDETLFISEDAEMNWRIRKTGHRIYFNPEIVSYYYPRTTISSFAKQLFRYGILRVNVIKKHADAIKALHLVPPLFLLLSIGLLLAGSVNHLLWLIFAGIWALYIGIVLLNSMVLAFGKGLRYVFILPVIFIIMHLCWAAGFITGIFKTRLA
jgi:GT2 family glycosyltransferase